MSSNQFQNPYRSPYHDNYDHRHLCNDVYMTSSPDVSMLLGDSSSSNNNRIHDKMELESEYYSPEDNYGYDSVDNIFADTGLSMSMAEHQEVPDFSKASTLDHFHMHPKLFKSPSSDRPSVMTPRIPRPITPPRDIHSRIPANFPASNAPRPFTPSASPPPAQNRFLHRVAHWNSSPTSASGSSISSAVSSSSNSINSRISHQNDKIRFKLTIIGAPFEPPSFNTAERAIGRKVYLFEVTQRLISGNNIVHVSASRAPHQHGSIPSEIMHGCQRKKENITAAVISCIWWEDKNDYFVTSSDIIRVVESLLRVQLVKEQKNRMRRQLQSYLPITLNKKMEDENFGFFTKIMEYRCPSVKSIDKDIKVFRWEILEMALMKLAEQLKPSSTNLFL
ncbi:hypothetical protein G6F46_002148 [Rhizopus delemar]|uniref:DUF7082 domain-containing protein n=1 Tax=Rhizopus delemar (strain RA 99-880 / ATCC MYA-4621 / FGSC 9543 / NRRL 43880) TaxID=246409 RepID=I1CSD6_RHIO9|nr:hypothetical protein RO3G_16077 [Rhizopus delemar RA 99-880]KAG1496410.1 hypothetical protein G6F54_006490 [Rhizopus delemar]KAG1510183.1 hypothetical protein G6F53_006874 [Rhizopus delemar]KAG1559851.1 hypothetical protein G6F49_003229 [Rhizopus delemar]KAG1592839.1 hypothetical protein G6F48_002393 [Rhizopus delemar]|eukprot:EIE91366.1 hypothetical protein RO3G_16077 [Rhizopus delemar RA 99-880]